MEDSSMLGTDFVGNLLLLLITAGLTGLLVPLLFRRIDERKHVERKLFEADLARQARIIDAQAGLIERFAGLVWEYQLLLASVPYYRQFEGRDLYPSALEAYEKDAVPLLGKIRAEISKALRLTERTTYEHLKRFYEQLLELDLKTSLLAQRDKAGRDVSAEWSSLQSFVMDKLSEEIDKTIDDLAREVRLKKFVPGGIDRDT
jgi:hypothetical protein